MPQLNTPRNADIDRLTHVVWPTARLGEALRCMAREFGLPASGEDVAAGSEGLEGEAFGVWLASAAELEGLQADPQIVRPAMFESLLRTASPLLLRIRLSSSEGLAFLAVVESHGDSVRVVGPDHRQHRVSVVSLKNVFLGAIEASYSSTLDGVIADLDLTVDARERVRTAMVAEQLASVRMGGCWLLRVPPGARIRDAAAEAGLTRGLMVLFGAHAVQSLLFVASWWLLGLGLMRGTFDRGWLLGWLLLLLSIVPLRAMTSWTQGLMATAIGAWLRRRLLRGALLIDRQQVRQNGAGRFFSLTVEASAVESLALNGGVATALSSIELVLAAIVIGLGAGLLPIALLFAWLVVAAWFIRRYVQRRQEWTEQRLRLTHDLVENMVGHRTRVIQHGAERWHQREDDALEGYVTSGRDMDQLDLALASLIPRGWLALAIVSLTPMVLAGATPERLAISIGGALLAFRALRRIMSGLSDLTGAVIAGRAVLPLLNAASLPTLKTSRAGMAQLARPADSVAAVEARNIAFSHRPEAGPVLSDCSFRLARGARVLLEGASGSGKTTLASIVAGLQSPESGLLLAGGLDRSVLGAAGWRRRVAMAPQPHDNYIVGGTLAFNLLMGRRWPARDSDLQDAEDICRELGLGDLLERMPAGLHQIVGETGWQLSQGERARVFLARALLQQSDLLVLDETFGALDPENVERAVRCVLQRSPTVLAIAHP